MAVLIALLFVAVVALAVTSYVRAMRRDARSVEAYKETLGRIQQVAEKGHTTTGVSRPSAPHVRILTRAGDPVASPVAPIDDTSHAPQPTFIPAAPAYPEIRSVLREVGSRRLVQRVVGLGAAAVVGVAVLLLADGGHHSAHPTAAAIRGHLHAHAAPVPTTAPTSAVLATSRTPDAAVYTVHSTPIRLALSAANPCWVEVVSESSAGARIFQGVLSAGAQKSFTDPGGLWLRLGYPAGVSIRIDGTTITVPPSSAPFDVTVRAASGAQARF